MDDELFVDPRKLAKQFVTEALATMLHNRAIENEQWRKDQEALAHIGMSGKRGLSSLVDVDDDEPLNAHSRGWVTRKKNQASGIVSKRTEQRRARVAENRHRWASGLPPAPEPSPSPSGWVKSL